MTLVVATAAVLGVTLVAGLVGSAIFLVQIRSLMADTAAALNVADEGASRLARHLEAMQRATQVAASELAAAET